MGRDSRRTRLLIVALLALAFTLITIDFHTHGSASGVRGTVHAAFGGVEAGVTAVFRPVGRTVSSLAHPNRYHDRADRLAADNARLQRQAAENAEVKRDAAELAGLRLVADKGQYTVVPARVIAIGDITGTDWNVTINAGRAEGIAPDAVVLDSDGLVGTIISATGHTAVVRLVCDPASHIGARLEGTRLLGAVAGGQGPHTLTFTLYDATHKVSPGDRLVTFGSVDYAAGVPIGVVTKVLDVGAGLSRTAEVDTFVSVGSLDIVGVVVGKPPADPGDRVLKPRPVPTTQAPAASPAFVTSPAPGSGQAPAGPAAGSASPAAGTAVGTVPATGPTTSPSAAG